jgi:hypothetical protein
MRFLKYKILFLPTELMMEMYYRGRFSGAATARIFIYVGPYEF